MRASRMLSIVLAVVAMVVVGLAPGWLVQYEKTPSWLFAWLVNLVLMLLIMRQISFMCGRRDAKEVIKGGAFAILVDDDNRFSLSRLQLVLWTLVVLSAFWTMAMARIGDTLDHPDTWKCNVAAAATATPAPATGTPEQTPAPAVTPAQTAGAQGGEEGSGGSTCQGPLDIQIPIELWALMGISMTAAVAAPLIKENKKQQTRSKTDEYQKMITSNQGLAKGQENEFYAVGAVLARLPEKEPEWADLFMSMDATGAIDMAKVQNFFFTVIAVVAYGIMLGAAFWGAFSSFHGLYQFPSLSEGLLAILGISHAAKLVEQNIVPPPQDPKPTPPQNTPPAEPK